MNNINKLKLVFGKKHALHCHSSKTEESVCREDVEGLYLPLSSPNEIESKLS